MDTNDEAVSEVIATTPPTTGEAANGDAKSTPGRNKVSAAASAKKRAPARTFSDPERADLMDAIAARVKETGCTFKEAIHQAGLSEQTYYLWKKLAKSTSAVSSKPAPVSVPGDRNQDDDAPESLATYPELLELHRENLRLRRALADKLRAENDELRKRIAAV